MSLRTCGGPLAPPLATRACRHPGTTQAMGPSMATHRR